jgi:hypothetical protein
MVIVQIIDQQPVYINVKSAVVGEGGELESLPLYYRYKVLRPQLPKYLDFSAV